ncbi:MAG: dihydrolipoyl dehydrogenase [Proteobacteria bacterium]|nr:dihydrolipoyl dehydrogenase [Pseudomonadota bacterium]
MKNNFDVVIIGAGPGGYVAAIRAAQLGMRTAIIEKDKLGGICLNWGCIPTKALLKASELYESIKSAEHFGISCSDIKVDFKKVIARSRDVASQLERGVAHLLKKNNVTVFQGFGKIKDKNTISVNREGGDDLNINAKNIIIATGARSREIKCDAKVWYSKDAMIQEKIPKSLLVIGSGAIGIEFASFYNAFGTKVTIIEMAGRILNMEDSEISDLAKKEFEAKGIEVLTNASVSEIKSTQNKITAKITRDESSVIREFDNVIAAIGVLPNTENLGLENIQCPLDETGHIEIDEYCRVSGFENIYAIGDIAKAPYLAHKASHEAIICAETIAGIKTHSIKRENIPACTYCTPQIASVGLNEKDAIKKFEKNNIKIGRFPNIANGKSVAAGKTFGLIKVIFEKNTGEILGSHIIGDNATELISNFTVAKSGELTQYEIMHTIFAHPTLSEMIHEVTLAADQRSIHGP